ncbi:hypothetical protein Drorol1_Dr00028232 [Drosera rotundifolia]
MVAPSISASSRAATTAAIETFVDTKRKDDIRHQDILASYGIADAVRTSLGPKGMDKMIQTASGEVIITNDDATILNKMEVLQPAAKMLVELSKSQDVIAGDGTTTVVVIAGAFLKKLRFRLSKLYSAKGLSLKVDALRSRAASVDVDDDLVSSSSRGGGGGLDDEDAEARVSGNKFNHELFYGLFLYNKNAMGQLERMDLAFEMVKRQLIERMHALVKPRSFHHWISTIRENG